MWKSITSGAIGGLLVTAFLLARPGAGQSPSQKKTATDIHESEGLLVRVRTLKKELDEVKELTRRQAEELTQLTDAVTQLRLQIANIEKSGLKSESFSILLVARGKTATDALKYAGSPPTGGEWAVVPTNPEGRPAYLHPKAYGDKVAAVWFTPIRSHAHDPAKWGFVTPLPGGLRGNQVQIISSAQSNAGHLEGLIHVLYVRGKP